MEAQNIALFLKQNPHFLTQHPDVLEVLQLGGSSTGSLAERQSLLLQKKKNELEKQLRQFLQNGEANDRISEQIHRLTLELIAYHSLPNLLEAIPVLIQEHFAAAHVVLRMWGNAAIPLSQGIPTSLCLAQKPGCWNALFQLTEMRQIGTLEPICNYHLPEEMLSWFPRDLKSFALLPLEHPAGAWGVLGLGSYDARRFQPTHGTLYLRRLSEIVSASLTSYF